MPQGHPRGVIRVFAQAQAPKVCGQCRVAISWITSLRAPSRPISWSEEPVFQRLHGGAPARCATDNAANRATGNVRSTFAVGDGRRGWIPVGGSWLCAGRTLRSEQHERQPLIPHGRRFRVRGFRNESPARFRTCAAGARHFTRSRSGAIPGVEQREHLGYLPVHSASFRSAAGMPWSWRSSSSFRMLTPAGRRRGRGAWSRSWMVWRQGRFRANAVQRRRRGGERD